MSNKINKKDTSLLFYSFDKQRTTNLENYFSGLNGKKIKKNQPVVFKLWDRTFLFLMGIYIFFIFRFKSAFYFVFNK